MASCTQASISRWPRRDQRELAVTPRATAKTTVLTTTAMEAMEVTVAAAAEAM